MVKLYTDIIKTLDGINTNELITEVTSATPLGSGNLKGLGREEITSNSKYSSRFNHGTFYPDD